MKKLDPFTALSLSAIVLPGVGQLYNRQYVKGAILIALFTGISLYLFYWVLVLGVGLILFLFQHDFLSWVETSEQDLRSFLTGLVILGVTWLISVVDAYFSANKRKPE